MEAMKWRARTIPDLIIEVWEALDCESVGGRELDQIQQALHARFGAGAFQSPAAIARAVADEGAALRHPEVFVCDLKWRKRKLDERSFQGGLDFSSLSLAFVSVVKLEKKRMELHRGIGEKGQGKKGIDNTAAKSKKLRDIVTGAREELLLRARSKILEENQRQEANEIAAIWRDSGDDSTTRQRSAVLLTGKKATKASAVALLQEAIKRRKQ